MTFDDYVNNKIKKAPKVPTESWLDMESKNQKRVKVFPYFDEIDRLVAIQALKDILYLLYRYKHYSDQDMFMDYYDQSIDNKKYGFAFYFKLSSLFDRAQLKGLKRSIDALKNVLDEGVKGIPEDLALKAEIDTYGNVIIKELYR